MKMRKFADEGFVREGKNENIDDETRARAMASVDKDPLGDFIKSRGLDSGLEAEPVRPVAAAPKAKPAIVTKEQLQAFKKQYGADKDLTDYMNAQLGRTRRGVPAADTSKAYDKEQQFQRAQEAAQTPEGKAKRAAMEKSQALEGSYPVENLAGGAAGLLKAGAGKLFGQGAAKVAAKRVEPTFREKELEVIKEVPRLLEGSKKLALPKPTPKLGYDKAGAKAVERGGRAEGRQAEMLKENARRSGLREDASAETLKAVRDKLGGDKFTVMKRGGSVQGYASGGAVSASRRGDGIAQRGKTRGKMC
jgi:hypothetical protein